MAETTTDPIHGCIDAWHAALRGDLETALDALLDDDCVFWSPVVFSPQRGKDLTKLYLLAAYSTFGGADGLDDDQETDRTDEAAATDADGGFRYVRRVLDGRDAVLEFEATLDGVVINGADFIRCDDEGRIVDFKVMLRPIRAVEKMRELMMAMLETMR